jgi:hypothetical protein
MPTLSLQLRRHSLVSTRAFDQVVIRFDAGAVARKTQGSDSPRILRLVDERADGVHLSYDSMASLLAPYDSAAAAAVATDLDAQVLRLLEDAAGAIDAPGPS